MSIESRPKTLAERCAAIELLVLDVDGVLTPGTIVYDENGLEQKHFHVRDGSALKLWQRAGRQAAVLSGRSSRAVEVRAAELEIRIVEQGAAEKLTAFRRILTRAGARPEQTACVGDDLPDLPLLLNCGLGIAVGDACPEVLATAHHVTRAPGGRGAVREAIELILRCQGKWQLFVESLCSERLAS